MVSKQGAVAAGVALAALASGLTTGLAGAPALAAGADPAGGGCAGVSVGPEREIVSDAARDRLGLDGWPDGPFGVLPRGDGTFRFYGTAAFGGPDATHPQRNLVLQGSLDDPTRDIPTRDDVVSTQIQGLPPGYIWAGGGPVHHDEASGITLQTLHLERRLGTTDFYSELHLGRLDPDTGVITYLGRLASPALAFTDATSNVDMGLPRLDVATEPDGTAYFRVHFPDFRLVDGRQAATGLSAARAPVREVLDAAAQGTTVEWRKYSGSGGWDQPAWGGDSADINPGRPMAWAPQVAHSSALDASVMAAAVSPREMVLSSSANGIDDWSPRVPLLRDPDRYDAYANLVGSGGDPDDLGHEFHLYYLQWPSPDPDWKNARVMRRTVTCTDGLPAEKRRFVRYVHGPRHIVTTAAPPAGYERESDDDWYLRSAHTPGTRALYGCRSGADDYFVSPDAACEDDGNTIVQTEGFIDTEPSTGSPTALYRCHIEDLGDHFVSTDANCEGNGVTQEGLLGYAPTGP